MGSYPRAIERAFINEKKKPFHKIAISGATTPHANQWIERLNNTVKERYKVQRGWKKDSTPLRNGQALYYNYIRPHMTHNGKNISSKNRITKRNMDESTKEESRKL